jgi:hypothetical protein
MRYPRLFALLAALALVTPGLASAGVSPGSGWSFTLSAWGGYTRYDVLGLRHGVGALDRDDLDGDLDAYGLSGVLRLGWLDLGVLYEGSFRRTTDSFVLTPLVGFKWDLTNVLRFDLLGELGGHRISNVGLDAESVWLPYVGVRPSLSLRLPLGLARLVLSATPFARWDLVKKEVTASDATGSFRYDVGGSTFGVVGGVGLEI